VRAARGSRPAASRAGRSATARAVSLPPRVGSFVCLLFRSVILQRFRPMGALDGWRFCPLCGEAIEKVEDRAECRACGNVAYANAVPGAEAVCFDAHGRVLLGRRAHDPGAGLWDLPGGFLHEDELPLEGLRREVREETALEIVPDEFLGHWPQP